MIEYFNTLETSFKNALEKNPSARKKYALEVVRLGKKLYEKENKIAWCGITAPFDLLNAMGITSCFVEYLGAMLASFDVVNKYLTEAENFGFVRDICAYHRSVIGAALKNDMPKPEFLIATTCPCSGGISALENLSKIFNKKLFVLNIPLTNEKKDVDFLVNQFKKMESFILEFVKVNNYEENLYNAILKTNKTRNLMIDIYNLTKQVPSPTNGHDLSNFGIIMSLFFGTDQGIQIASAYKDEFESKIQLQKKNPPNEKLRLMWIQNRVQFKSPIEKILKDEYNANIVVDELNDITWDAIDPENPYPGLASRSISIPFNGDINSRINHLKKLALEYKIDGAINPCHWGCRQGTGARGLISKGLKEIDVPVLNLEVDVIDTRNFSEGQIRTRIDAFMEMISN